jgi:hypothetical protein
LRRDAVAIRRHGARKTSKKHGVSRSRSWHGDERSQDEQRSK